MFAKTSARSTSKIAFLLALLLLFALTTAALAAPLANGTFGDAPNCNIDGWSTSGTGTVTAMPGSSSISFMAGTDCLAKAHATLGGFTYSSSATLIQSFEVPQYTSAGSQDLVFNVWARSSNGIDPIDCNCYPSGNAYAAQTISLYDAAGNVIYNKSRNINMTSTETGQFGYNLSAYAGQTVTLKIRVSVSSFSQTSPDWSTIYVDDVRFGPVPYGGGGYFGW